MRRIVVLVSLLALVIATGLFLAKRVVALPPFPSVLHIMPPLGADAGQKEPPEQALTDFLAAGYSAAEIGQLFADPGSVIGADCTPVVPDVDSDGDGYTDAQEELAGTDPNDPNDFIRISSIQPTEDGGEIAWKSEEGILYDVEYSLDLTPGSWVVITDEPIVGTGGTLTFEDTSDRGEEPHGYWRVRVVPQDQ